MERNTHCVPQSAFFDEGLEFDDLQLSGLFTMLAGNAEGEHVRNTSDVS